LPDLCRATKSAEDILFGNLGIAKYVRQVFLRLIDQMLENIKAVEMETSPKECKNSKQAIGHEMIEGFEKFIESICH
jgi:hypothetical protein